MATKKILEDICSDECDGRYCILKEFIIHGGFADRQLEQIKCVEKYKYEESKKEGKDIGWNEAFQRWVDKGYAKRYAQIYSEDKTFRQLYKETIAPQ
jgi:hypothetical protein